MTVTVFNHILKKPGTAYDGSLATLSEVVAVNRSDWLTQILGASSEMAHEEEATQQPASNRGDVRYALNTLRRRPEIILITDSASVRKIQTALLISSKASPNCNANKAASWGGKEIRRVTSSVHVTSKT